MKLEKLFNPKSIAIVGATDEEGKVGTAICNNILNLGYEGKVFLVNPKHQELFGQKCYAKLEEIEEDVDLAIIVIPAKFVPETIKNAGNKVKDFAVISAGFSEIGEDGKKLEQELLKIAEEKDLNILGPNCLGFIIPKLKLNASFGGGLPKQGNISFISQSGALISAILDISEKENFGFSNIISIGNKMQIDESDLFEYLKNDKETKVIGMYLEGIRDGEKFKNLASKISASKPVVILKAGKTEKAKKAISSHTGALAGSEEITNALFQKTGIIEAENFDEFLSILSLISISDCPQNEKVIVVTNAGGPGVLTTDAFYEKEIKLAEISDGSKNQLREFLPQESSVENPIDLLGDAQENRYEKTLEIIKNETAGSIIAVLTPQENTPIEKISQKIIEFKEKNQKNITAVFLGGKKVQKPIELLKQSGVPNFSSPEKAVLSLDKYYKWGIYKNKEIEKYDISPSESLERKTNTQKIIENVKSEVRTILSFSEAKRIMDIYDINTIKYQEISLKNELEIDFPLVMKVDSDKVFHKTDKQGVILNIENEEELKEAYVKMNEKFPNERIIIQPMEKVQTELILGIKKDETIGPVIVFGLGGIYTEIFKMVDFILPPAGIKEIKNIVWNSPIGFLFKETRGQNAYNLEEISEILFKLCQIALEIEEIREFDINPLLVYNNSKKALAVDVKIII